MTDMDFSIPEDTQATLLLCGTLGKDNGAARPLTLPQYNAVVQALVSLDKRPSDLLHEGGLAETICSMPVENARLKEPASADRLKTLLDRGFALSMALNRWAQYGVRPVGRGDGLYPARMKLYLKGKAPAILYYAGSDQLWSGGGMAFVGSRNISDEATEAIRRVVRECVDANMPIVSGGARGADQTSMRTAFECGGSVVAALPGDLLKTCLTRENREATKEEIDHLIKILIEAYDLIKGLGTRHRDEHFLESLIVGERQHGHLTQGDGLGIETDDKGVGTGELFINGNKTSRITDTTHPKRVDLPCLDVKMAVLVADGATMRHLTDDVRVADGFQAIGSDHIAIKIHTFGLVFVIALREGENTAQ